MQAVFWYNTDMKEKFDVTVYTQSLITLINIYGRDKRKI